MKKCLGGEAGILTSVLKSISGAGGDADGAATRFQLGRLTVGRRALLDDRSLPISLALNFRERREVRVIIEGPKGLVLDERLESDARGNVATILKLPRYVRGHHTIEAHIRADDTGVWIRAARDWFYCYPKLKERLRDLGKRLVAMEEDSTDPSRLASIWTAQMHLGLIQHRLRTLVDLALDTDYIDWGVRELGIKVKSMESGKHPYMFSRGHVVRGYRSKIDDRLQPYSIYVPGGYKSDRKWPLVVMLHGALSNHFLAMRRVFGYTNAPGEPDLKAKKNPKDLPEIDFLVVCPNGRETLGYRGIAEQDFWEVLRVVQANYNIDPDRIYLTGLSMGGRGTIDLVLRYPDVFAAAVPICGFYDWYLNRREQAPETCTALEKARDHLSLAENARHIPIRLCHGTDDPVVSVEHSRRLFQRLQELRYTAEYEEYLDVGHDAWEPAYRDRRVFDWFRQFTRKQKPNEVVFRTTRATGGSAYWLSIDTLVTPRTLAEINGQAEKTTITIRTENVESLTINPEKLPETVTLPATIIIDGKIVGELADSQALSFVLTDAGFVVLEQKRESGLLPGLFGVAEAAMDRHAYIYSTQGSDEEGEITKALAASMADWGDWADVRWPVLPDEEAPADRNLILFGTAQGNSVLKKIIGSLPIQSGDDSFVVCGKQFPADHACRMIYPNPDNPEHYVLVHTAGSVSALSAIQSGDFREWVVWNGAPDLIVVNSAGEHVWSALFDKNWEVSQTAE